MTTRFTEEGFNISNTPIAEEDMGALHAYMNAHALLPADYHLGGSTARALAQEALDSLGNDAAPEVAWLRSIVILGHTPTAAALQALDRHAQSGRPLAGMAKMASDECADWMSDAAATDTLASDMVN